MRVLYRYYIFFWALSFTLTFFAETTGGHPTHVKVAPMTRVKIPISLPQSPFNETNFPYMTYIKVKADFDLDKGKYYFKVYPKGGLIEIVGSTLTSRRIILPDGLCDDYLGCVKVGELWPRRDLDDFSLLTIQHDSDVSDDGVPGIWFLEIINEGPKSHWFRFNIGHSLEYLEEPGDPNPQLDSIAVYVEPPAQINIDDTVDDTLQFHAIGIFEGSTTKILAANDGLQWSSSNDGIKINDKGIANAEKESDKVDIKAAVGDISNSATIQVKSEVKAPVITNYTPRRALHGVKQRIIIFGNNFAQPDIEVFFGNQTVDIGDPTDTRIVTQVPAGLSEGKIFLKVCNSKNDCSEEKEFIIQR